MGFVAIVTCGAMVVLAVRRKRAILALQKSITEVAGDLNRVRFSAWVEIAILIPIVIVPLMTFAAVEYSRSLMLSAVAPNPATKTMFAMAAGITGHLHAVPLGSILMLVYLPLAGIGMGFALTYRYQGRVLNKLAGGEQCGNGKSLPSRWKPVPSTSMVVLTILGFTELAVSPMLVGFIRWANDLVGTASVLMHAPPSEKASLLLEGIKESQLILAGGAKQSLVGLVLVFVVACTVTFYRHRTRRLEEGLFHQENNSGSSNIMFIALLVLCLVGSALSIQLALPYYEENGNPLPTNSGFSLSKSDDINTPDLQGPDTLKRSPVLAFAKNGVTLDHSPLESATAMMELLDIMKLNFKSTYHGEAFPGTLVLQADKSIKATQLLPYFQTALKAGYGKVQFAFSTFTTIERPVLGTVRLMKSNAAQISLVDSGSMPVDPVSVDLDKGMFSGKTSTSKEVILKSSPKTSYEKLALAAANARNKGLKVILPIPREEPKPSGAAIVP
jgi:hypothetical protein